MNHFYTIIISLLLLSSPAQAQRFNWSTSAGYPGVANSYYGTVDLATDNDGNVYVMDFANLNQVCQGDTIELVSPGSNLFVYKFSPEGNLIWAKAFGAGSGGGSVTPLNLESGPDNSLFALIHINASNIVTEDSTFQVSAPSNVILNINENGQINWVQSAGFSCPACLMLEVANDRIYYQSGQSRIESMELDQTPDTNYSFYFDPGTAIFTIPFQGSAVFSNGDLLLAGLQRGDASFIEGDTLLQVGNPFLYNNISYVRLTPDLQPVWANTFGTLHDPETHFIPTEIDANNQIYTGWEVLDTISIAGTTVIGNFNNWAGTILSMDGNGNPLWLRELESAAALRINYLLADAETNKVWLTGISSSSTTIGDSIIVPGVNGSPILAAVSPSGVFSSQTALNQMPGGSQGRTIGKAASGQFYLGGNLNGGGDYSINCIDNEGAKGLYLASFLDVPQNPPTPQIISDGTLLTANPDFKGTIQWFFEGEEIPGANAQTLQATDDGNYSVVFSYDFGCEGEASSEVVFVSTAISQFDTEIIEIFPNPATTELHIKYLNGKSVNAELLSMDGKLVKRTLFSNQTIDVSDLTSGLYFVRVSIAGRNYMKKVFINSK
jgi:hypothetical protein